ncbi:phage tail protein [Algoriella sp.]|uniref:phage tail protein n=1 Tax=Algoriella sp. TaxID=1872434 RepID=UPI002FCA9B44
MEEFIGSIKIFAGNFAPRGWAMCYGQILPINQNQALFSILGTTYGGNGVSTFGLPDLRGRVPVGTGSGPGLSNIVLGEVGGTENTTLLTTNLPAHIHPITPTTNVKVSNKVGDSSDPRGKALAEGAQIGSGPNATKLKPYVTYSSTDTNNGDLAGVTSASSTVNTGNNSAFSIKQPYLGVSYIICLEGIYPSRN